MAYYYIKSTAEIMENIINNIHDTLPDVDTKEGTFIRNVFVNPTSDEIAAMYGDMFNLKLSQSIITAIADDLDYLAANYFVVRKEASVASGKLRFYITNSNKSQSEITESDIPAYIQIPTGTRASTTASYGVDSISFETTQVVYYEFEAIKRLPIDSETGYRYLEVAAIAVDPGEAGNVAAGTIVNLQSSVSGIFAVKNPFSFIGGQDTEDDASLTERIRLAITGNNIGTKDGYLKYALDQNNVVDAKVVGAGDDIMFRDGGYIDDDGNYQYGEGGCVDIYVRGHQPLEATYTFHLTTGYMQSTTPYADIVLPSNPVTSIASITSNTTGETFINAEIYETEQYSYTQDDTTSMETFYAVDILWDFSLTDAFPDTDYYANPSGLTASQIAALKVAVDEELLAARATYMANLTYGIDWSTASTRSTSAGQTTYFRKVYINNTVYKLVAKDTANLDGRTFIMKNDEIYVRAYVEPDYILKKDTSDYAGSMTGEDAIHWLNTSKLLLNDVLTINYNYDSLITTLQTGVDDQRCLTADVLVKQAIEIPLEIVADIVIYNNTTKAYMKRKIASDINTFIATNKTLGGDIDATDLVAIMKSSDYVDSVDLTTLKMSIKGQAPQSKITITDNQYFTLSSLVLNITYRDSVTS